MILKPGEGLDLVLPVSNPVPQFTFLDETTPSPLPKLTEPPTDLRWLRVEEFLRSLEQALCQTSAGN